MQVKKGLFGFEKFKRLLNKKNFDEVFKFRNKKVATKFFQALIKKNNLLYSRIGIIVQKKNIKNAAKRILIKRIIRESFRNNQNTILNSDIVIIVSGNIKLLESKKEIRKEIDKVWEKIH